MSTKTIFKKIKKRIMEQNLVCCKGKHGDVHITLKEMMLNLMNAYFYVKLCVQEFLLMTLYPSIIMKSGLS
jgi:hypothetical protein